MPACWIKCQDPAAAEPKVTKIRHVDTPTMRLASDTASSWTAWRVWNSRVRLSVCWLRTRIFSFVEADRSARRSVRYSILRVGSSGAPDGPDDADPRRPGGGVRRASNPRTGPRMAMAGFGGGGGDAGWCEFAIGVPSLAAERVRFGGGGGGGGAERGGWGGVWRRPRSGDI